MAQVVMLPLSQGLEAIIDAADEGLALSEGSWYAAKSRFTYYARRNVRRDDGTRGTIRLHNFLTGYDLVDHVNGDGLDNRRVNLRPVSQTQNQCNKRRQTNNTSGFVGVNWFAPQGRWMCRIYFENKAHFLGYYDTAEEAARVRDAAALKMHGPYAKLNFPLTAEG